MQVKVNLICCIAKPDNYGGEIGSTIRVCLRPEAIQIVDEKSPERPWIAKLTETVYLGPIAQHRFARGKIILKVTEANPKPAQFHIGSDYFLRVVPDDVILLPACAHEC